MERRYGGQREGKCKVVRRDKVQVEGGEKVWGVQYTVQNRREGGHRRERRGRV